MSAHRHCVASLVDGIDWPSHTERPVLRPATVADVDATWGFRQLESVSRWLTGAPQTLAEYRSQFIDPESLAKSLVIECEGEVIGDLMVAIGESWAGDA